MSTRLRLFPLNAVLFPGAVLHLHVFEPRYKQMIGECLESGEGFGVVLIRDGDESGDTQVQPHDIGSVAQIVDVAPLPFGRYYLSTVGKRRFRIMRIVSREPYLTVDAELLEEDEASDKAVASLRDEVRDAFLEYLDLLVQFNGEQPAIDLPHDPLSTSFIIGDALQIADKVKQRLLELDGTKQRLTLELGFLRRLIPQLRALLKERESELQARAARGDEEKRRSTQQRYFGKYFSPN